MPLSADEYANPATLAIGPPSELYKLGPILFFPPFSKEWHEVHFFSTRSPWETDAFANKTGSGISS